MRKALQPVQGVEGFTYKRELLLRTVGDGAPLGRLIRASVRAEKDTVDSNKTKCRHCGRDMSKWMPPDDSSWDQLYQYVCFNDNCPYFVEGWKWMKDKYSQHASYRYRYDPHTGQEGPLPVWSAGALRGRIIEQREEK